MNDLRPPSKRMSSAELRAAFLEFFRENGHTVVPSSSLVPGNETSVYRVTRWRKGKLALAVLAGLALNYGMDAAIAKIGETTPLLPALGEWVLRLC